MTNAKHTPGPWTIYKSGHKSYIELVGHPTHTPCTIAEISPEDENSSAIHMADANARLIAAAPDLLEALANLWKFCIPSDQTAVGRIHLDAARAAIAKATGAA